MVIEDLSCVSEHDFTFLKIFLLSAAFVWVVGAKDAVLDTTANESDEWQED